MHTFQDTGKSQYLHTGINQIVIDEIRKIASDCSIKTVILFGSRARGDFKERSDIDLAVSGGDVSHFSLDVDESTSTLLKYDIVNLDKHVQPELLTSIKSEGMIIYEKI